MSINSYQQRKIIETINGPILVIAGAGSGKTRVIIHRIVYMIKNIGINPSNILVLTFTKKSAKEMRDRISNIMDKKNLDQITLGTFHSIFSNILRIESHWLGYKPNYTIYDQKDSENVIKKILKEINFNISLTPREVRNRISEYKNNLYNDDVKNQLSESFTKIYKYYIKRCFQANALDFDDILLQTNYLFFHFPHILKKYQEKFKYILIDEYQDTNSSQYTIIKSLASKYKNIFVVGDDAQSIYAFRGANISNILNFHIDYNKAKIFRLEQNYRSTNYIVQASNNIISFNKNQILKKIWTNNEKGEKVKIYGASSDKEEAQYIAYSILSMKEKKKLSFNNFAILYRVNIQSYIIEYALKEKNIPYKIYGSISFEKKKEIRDLFAYFRIITNPNDEESLLRILKKENQKIVKNILNLSRSKKNSVYEIVKNIENYQFLLKISEKTKDKLKKIILTIEKIRSYLEKKNAYVLSKEIIIFLLEKYDYFHEDFEDILKNICYYVHEQKKLKNGDISLSGFLRHFYLETFHDYNNEKNKVSLMTIHLSKGLEFSIVFIAGLEENLFPSKSSIDNLKIEEERRLFYVALTRAQKIAILTYAKYRFLWGIKKKNIPSRFMNELNREFINVENDINHRFSNKKKVNIFNDEFDEKKKKNLKKGEKVFHKNFGTGVIVDLQNKNQIAVIDFEKYGIKRILVKLEKFIISS
ncbi:ATP-dependent helicase [Blattabacterium cuenoti]|uniref:ATP-dependent helicase n=1 Tax=Blattabacterium cuenoti TaxID=1653831 RepID=UPI00163C3749|nr:UvrD-helicase domain-containing protein [Blattabacterium cuenoti]